MSTSIQHSYDEFSKPDEYRLTYERIMQLEAAREARYQRRMLIAKKFAITILGVATLSGLYVYSKNFSADVKAEQEKVEHTQGRKDTTTHAVHYHTAPAPAIK